MRLSKPTTATPSPSAWPPSTKCMARCRWWSFTAQPCSPKRSKNSPWPCKPSASASAMKASVCCNKPSANCRCIWTACTAPAATCRWWCCRCSMTCAVRAAKACCRKPACSARNCCRLHRCPTKPWPGAQCRNCTNNCASGTTFCNKPWPACCAKTMARATWKTWRGCSRASKRCARARRCCPCGKSPRRWSKACSLA
ncbi:hypothetical protein [Pseudomonas sp. 22 E 5]|nr:hypothetical protein [Pseudomonas sp. 22 E 5]